jgi:hypothetical protein
VEIAHLKRILAKAREEEKTRKSLYGGFMTTRLYEHHLDEPGTFHNRIWV